ncbi:MAG: hypothetical protein AAGH64_03015 [Planctomycetota bacterium]
MQILPSVVVTVACACALAQPASAPENALRGVFVAEAGALSPLVRTNVARDFLRALEHLPGVGERAPVWYDSQTRRALTSEQFGALPMEGDEREAFAPLPIDDRFYYAGVFGTPALYTRTLELASAHGVASIDGAHVLDFGFGHIGHLRAMASLGAHCVGIEVSEMIERMYSEPGDVGVVPRHLDADAGHPGTLRLVFGSWPGDDAVRTAVGGPYDLIITKNVLKRGYIYPEREADLSQLIDLGVEDDVFIGALFDALRPGGVMVLYNYSPKQAGPDEDFIPWADGRCPFGERQWLDAGFEVLAHDEDDTESAIDHFVAVNAGDREALEGNLFGMYTVVRRPAD